MIVYYIDLHYKSASIVKSSKSAATNFERSNIYIVRKLKSYQLNASN